MIFRFLFKSGYFQDLELSELEIFTKNTTTDIIKINWKSTETTKIIIQNIDLKEIAGIFLIEE